ncbi:putative nuclease HARBI1 [Tachysurus fulvidraco]|uniref:putative nuclease HARBI1 n=1 Tax=Tachysurus fulvidraco TaxID=1234273 RepID=UPI001FEDD6F1|nr:putative nuclease HARBI1 [Tachysurus fulvidraco]
MCRNTDSLLFLMVKDYMTILYRESTLSNRLERGEIDGFLLGDRGYPCQPNLITPYSEAEPGPQQRLNVAHCRMSARVEMTIGLLKARFQCLCHLRVTPERACDIIVACVVLHNIAIIRGEQHLPYNYKILRKTPSTLQISRMEG